MRMRMKNNNETIKDRIILGAIYALSILALLPFFFLLFTLLKEGLKGFSFDFFSLSEPTSFETMLAQVGNEAAPGGILNGILGTFYLVLIALFLAIPLGFVTAVYLVDFAKTKFATVLHYLVNILHGVPSVILGIISYLWIVKTFHNYSALAGGVALALVILPIFIKEFLSILNRIPFYLREGAHSLGGTYFQVTMTVLLPSVKTEITASILTVTSRALGETSPLIFTALGTSVINWHINQPVSSMPLLVWEFFNNPYLIQFMWSAALFLLLIILSLNILAKYLLWKANK